MDLNPLAPEPLSNLALALVANGQAERGLRTARRALEIQPDFETSSFYEGLALYHLGRFDEAVPILQRIAATWSPTAPAGVLGLTEAARGDVARARELMEQLKTTGDFAGVGLLHAALGEMEEAFDAFQKVTRWEYWASLSILNFFEDVLAPLRLDGRYEPLLRGIKASWRVGHTSQR